MKRLWLRELLCVALVATGVSLMLLWRDEWGVLACVALVVVGGFVDPKYPADLYRKMDLRIMRELFHATVGLCIFFGSVLSVIWCIRQVYPVDAPSWGQWVALGIVWLSGVVGGILASGYWRWSLAD